MGLVVRRVLQGFLITVPGLVFATPAFAATSEQKCGQSLSIEAAKYRQCFEKEVGKLYGGRFDSNFITFTLRTDKCLDRYLTSWTKLASKYAGKGTACEGDRFVDNGDGTFYDRLTRLTWEKKTNDGSIHDMDNTYSWSLSSSTTETGTVFTEFLEGLNTSGFANSSGWRVPSIYELYTLSDGRYPECTVPPCSDVPGETASSRYWSSSTLATDPALAWFVNFFSGTPAFGYEDPVSHARAVRGGS